MSNRKITKEQFTDGTTIDGTRIEKALDDIATRFNNVVVFPVPGGPITIVFI